MSPLLAAIPCLFVSGACALVYESVWIRQASYIFGSTVVATTLVLTAFMGGLALGAAAAGKVADRLSRPLRTYGWLEVAVALSALTFSPGLALVEGFDFQIAAQPGVSPAATRAFEMAALFSLLLVPTALMGATLPVLCAAGRADRTGSTLGLLYSANCSGAVAGSLAAGFFLIERFGLSATVSLAAHANAAAGVLAIAADRLAVPAAGPGEPAGLAGASGAGPGEPAPAIDPAPAVVPAPARPAEVPLPALFAATFASGFTAMLYEVALMKLLPLVLGSSIHAFALMVSAFITGGAAGSAAAARLVSRLSRPSLAIGVLHGVVGLTFGASIPLHGHLPVIYLATRLNVDISFGAFQALAFGICFVTMALPAVGTGAMLPLVAEAVARHGACGGAGATAGRVYAASTAGNILGTALTGLVLVPSLGFKGAMEVGIAVNALACIGLGLLARGVPRSFRWAATIAPAAALATYFAWHPRLDTLALTGAVFRSPASQPTEVTGARTIAGLAAALRADREIVFLEEDGHALVSVDRWRGRTLSLRVNGKVDASDSLDMLTQRVLAHFPLLVHGRARTAAIIGFGSGVTAASALKHPLERVDCVEISPAVVRASRLFAPVNGDVEKDPRLNLVIDDARRFMARSRATYDVIISEPSNPWLAGISSLYTVEFFRSLERRLAPDGVLAQWIHTYDMDEETLRIILRTVRRVFPHTFIMDGTATDLVVLGSGRAFDLDCARIARRMGHPPVKADLAAAGITSALLFAGHQKVTPEDFDLVCGTGSVNTDDRPVLEYRAPRALFSGERVRISDSRFRAAAPHHLLKRCAGPGPPSPAEVLDLCRHFRPYYDLDLVTTLLADVIARDASSAEARMMLARLRLGQGEPREALALAREAAAIAPASLPAQNLLYEAAMAVEGQELSLFAPRELRAALQAARAAAGLAPERHDLLVRVAEVHHHRGEYAQAEAAMLRVLDLARAGPAAPDPPLPYYLALLAQCRLRQGDVEGAAGWLARARAARADLDADRMAFCAMVAAEVDASAASRASPKGPPARASPTRPGRSAR
jgi:predicted membrane-bound spermidine synthase/tetratricopeptide (TPR) repeat protein